MKKLTVPCCNKLIRCSLRGFLLALIATVMTNAGQAQTVYTYSGAATTSGNNWSTSTNWTPSGVPGASGLGTTDIANLGNETANTIVIYDGGASGYLGGINITQTTTGVTNLLDLQNNLTVANAITLGASGTGVAVIRLNPVTQGVTRSLTASGGVVLNAGGVLEMGSNVSSGNLNAANLNGNVTISGGTLQIDRGYGAGVSSGAANYQVNGAVTMTSGTLSIATAQSPDGAWSSGNGTPNTYLTITGDFNMSGGTVAGSAGFNPAIYLQGANNTITGGTFTGSGGGVAAIVLNGSANPTGAVMAQTFKSDVSLATAQASTGLTFLGAGAASSAAQSTYSFTIGAYTEGGTLTLYRLQPTLSGSGSWGVINLNLSSDVIDARSSAPFAATSTGAGTFTINFDTAGHVLDLTASTAGWTPNNGNGSATTVWNLASSTSGGVIKAKSFTLNSTGVTTSVGSGLTLQASGVGVANVLSGTGAISSGSRFHYVGAGSSTLTSNRSIGALAVGTGTSASVLQLSGAALTANGGVAVNSGATLDLNGNNLTLGVNGTKGGRLEGVGTLSNTSATSVTVAFTNATTKGGLSAGGDGSVGTFLINGSGSGGLILNLNNTISTFDITGTSTYDQISLSGLTTVNFSGATIDLNFSGGGYTSGSLQLFTGLSATDMGAVTITSNLSGDYSFDSATGILTYSAVPESSSGFLFSLGLMALLFFRRQQCFRRG